MEKIKIIAWLQDNTCGSGYGYGSGFGSGFGSGDGYGISFFGGHDVFMVDNVATIITGIHGNLAMGYILNQDFTLYPCYVVKGNGYFAHGETAEEANNSLREKIFENMDEEEAIDKFTETFKPDEKYPCKMFYEWHHYLTGSCEMGRKSFMRNHGITMDDTFSVSEFIELCENDYGGDIIKRLKEHYAFL